MTVSFKKCGCKVVKNEKDIDYEITYCQKHQIHLKDLIVDCIFEKIEGRVKVVKRNG